MLHIGQKRHFPAERYPGFDCVCQEMKVSRWELDYRKELMLPWKGSASSSDQQVRCWLVTPMD